MFSTIATTLVTSIFVNGAQVKRCQSCDYDSLEKKYSQTDKCNHKIQKVILCSPFIVIAVAADILYFLKK